MNAFTPIKPPALLTELEGFKAGQRVQFNNANLGICRDTIRALFWQTAQLEPYARNVTFAAAILTEYSWIPLSECKHTEE